MGTHTLVLTLDSTEQAKLDAGEYVFPEHPESRNWHIRCDDPSRCIGWNECRRQHICKHGHDILYDELSPDGPCPGHEHNCVGEDDEETFHGEDHTHRWGWGWTVPFIGCVVAENWDGDLPCGIDSMPIGEYPVDEDWYDDTSVSLTLADAA